MNDMKSWIFIGTIAAMIAVAAPAFAVGLTDADFAYLATQDVKRDNPVLHNLSPKEQSRLHALINDLTTKDNAAAQAKNVTEILAEFLQHQTWEQNHPGELWDSPKQKKN